MLGRTRRVHFVGVGGSGMSGIAELLANLGYAVSGSDAKLSAVTAHLAVARRPRSRKGTRPATSATPTSSCTPRPCARPTPRSSRPRRRRIPVIPRAEMLAELMRLKYSVAVAGAHGKTTTTSMIALVLERGGLDPTAVIGGRLSAFGSSARLGRGDLMVVEADESDRSFLKLTPSMAVITNIDQEHLESYRDFEDLQQAFVAFANKVPFYGAIVACADDELAAAAAAVDDAAGGHLRPRRPTARTTAASTWPAPASTGAARWCATRASRARATAVGPETLGQIVLHVPGRHNLQNALAAVAVGMDLGLPFARIADALAEVRGAPSGGSRITARCAAYGSIEDYGHHPTEIAAVIGAARAALGGRLVVVFQPHRYSRTSRLLDRFGPALKGADVIVLTDIYAAGEDPIPNVTVDALADAIRRHAQAPLHLVRDVGDVPAAVASLARPGDVILTLGAGSIGAASDGDRVGVGAGARGDAIVRVTAPSDRRFLRAQVKPGRRRVAVAAVAAPLPVVPAHRPGGGRRRVAGGGRGQRVRPCASTTSA